MSLDWLLSQCRCSYSFNCINLSVKIFIQIEKKNRWDYWRCLFAAIPLDEDMKSFICFSGNSFWHRLKLHSDFIFRSMAWPPYFRLPSYWNSSLTVTCSAVKRRGHFGVRTECENLPVSPCKGSLIAKDEELKRKLGLRSIEPHNNKR